MKIPQIELKLIVAAKFPALSIFNVLCADVDYELVPIEGIYRFNRELSAALFDYYGDKWEEYNDCDNFALEAHALACRKHYRARQAGKGSAQGVAFGRLNYTTRKGVPHQINIFVTETKEVVLYEPQRREIVHFTEEETKSVRWVFFS